MLYNKLKLRNTMSIHHWQMIMSTLIILIGEHSGEETLSMRIVGGRNVEVNEIPYQVSIKLMTGHLCGGSIVSPYFVITAAHCLYDFKNWKESMLMKYLYVVAGTTTIKFAFQNSYPIRKICLHPEYFRDKRNNPQNDIALVEVSEMITHGSAIPVPSEPTEPGTQCQISGWGTTKRVRNMKAAPDVHMNEQLKAGKVIISDFSLCRNMSRARRGVICAKAAGVDTCQGDSGGPLVCGGELAGVASWGYGCAWSRPGIYTNVVEYRAWIRETMAHSSPPLPHFRRPTRSESPPTHLPAGLLILLTLLATAAH